MDAYRRLCLMQILPQTCISLRSPARGKQSAHSDTGNSDHEVRNDLGGDMTQVGKGTVQVHIKLFIRCKIQEWNVTITAAGGGRSNFGETITAAAGGRGIFGETITAAGGGRSIFGETMTRLQVHHEMFLSSKITTSPHPGHV